MIKAPIITDDEIVDFLPNEEIDQILLIDSVSKTNNYG